VSLGSAFDGCRRWVTELARRRGGRIAPEAFLEQCYWLLLGRSSDPTGRGTFLPLLRAGRAAEVVDGVLASREFHERHISLSPQPAGAAAEAGLGEALSAMGSDAAFLDLSHRVILGRRPSPHERRTALSQLRCGAGRAGFVHSLLCSQEVRHRYAGPVPEDQQLCELANPAKWDNTEWMALLQSLQVRADKIGMHRKVYEYTQTLFGLRRLGVIHADARVLGVGAGHEPVLYWLANHVHRVVATDLYGARWQSGPGAESGETMLRQPDAFAPFPYRRERLTVLRMDGRHLAFADASFDAVYSLSSIEHFGGAADARRAVDEMARVLKPGGVLALATEWCVAGPACAEVFTPDDVRALIDSPVLTLVEPVDDRVWHRYRTEVVDLRSAQQRTPHMLVRHGETVFTSVMLFLRKAGA
jgi:SAM-dependent methyltransferase